MNRRALLSLLLLTPLAAHAQTAPSAQDKADIARIEAYMNGLRTLKARFLQVAPDGATTGGTAWLQRPGQMRFQYNPPSPLLQLNQTTNIPLSSTPLGLLLQDNLKLSGDVTVTSITRSPGQLQLTLVRTASPADGSLTLVFADNPLVLRQWAVVDSQRRETRVTLYDVELGGKFDPELFHYIDPKFFKNQAN